MPQESPAVGFYRVETLSIWIIRQSASFYPKQKCVCVCVCVLGEGCPLDETERAEHINQVGFS